MNILLITMGMDIGGAETHILELAKELKRRNHDVYVMSNGGAYVGELNEFGIAHIHAPLNSRSIKSMYNSFKIIDKTVKEKNINIIHSHARIPSFVSGFVSKKRRVAFVTTDHGTYKVTPLLKLVSNWGEYTLAVSEDVKRYLIDNYNVKEEDIFITVNGIDTNKFIKGIDCENIKEELQIKNDEKNIVYVGRLDEGRVLSVEQLINITPSLYEENSKINVIIVGGGDVYERLKQKAEDVNKQIGKNVIKMLGNKTNVHEYLAVADIFVGVSRAVLEAMAEEVPSIVAGSDGYLGIFTEEKLKSAIDTNFCCRDLEMSTEKLIQSDIIKLLGMKQEELIKMGDYGRKVVKEFYSIEKMANDAEKVYKIATHKNIKMKV